MYPKYLWSTHTHTYTHIHTHTHRCCQHPWPRLAAARHCRWSAPHPSSGRRVQGQRHTACTADTLMEIWVRKTDVKWKEKITNDTHTHTHTYTHTHTQIRLSCNTPTTLRFWKCGEMQWKHTTTQRTHAQTQNNSAPLQRTSNIETAQGKGLAMQQRVMAAAWCDLVAVVLREKEGRLNTKGKT